MIPSFNQQSSKNIGVLEDTLLLLVQSLPKGTLAKYGYSCADAAVKNLNIRKVPGLVALPNIKRSDYEKDILQLVPDNVLFEDNLSSSLPGNSREDWKGKRKSWANMAKRNPR